MTARGRQDTSEAKTRSGRPVRIAHRKTPSELTPLMQENLALQQQIEILQAQQQMLAHQQQYGPQSLMVPPGAYGQMVTPVSMPYPSYTMPPPVNPNDYHQRSKSFNQGHHRRQSLAVSEAKKAAQDKREESPTRQKQATPGSPSKQRPMQSGDKQTHSAQSSQPYQAPRPYQPNQPYQAPIQPYQAPNQPYQAPNQPYQAPNQPYQAPTQPYQAPNQPYVPISRSGQQQQQQPQFKFPPSSPQRSSSPPRQFQFPAQPFTPGHARPGNSQSFSSTGGGHQHRRTNSRMLESNWRQHKTQNHSMGHPQGLGHRPAGSDFVPGHHARNSFGSFSSVAGFMDHQSGPGGRKSLFVPHLNESAIPQLLAEGLLVIGTLRVNRKNRSDAYVSTDVLDADIFICGSKDRNRALEGDLVAVELLDVNDVWGAKREKEEKKLRRDQNEDARFVEIASGELRRKGSLRQRPTQKRNDDTEVEGQTLLLREEQEVSDEQQPLYAGHVVAIIERPASQMFSGTLGLLRPSSQATKERQEAERLEKGQPPLQENRTDKPKIVWFKPTNKCVPLMAVSIEQAPRNFLETHQSYADRIFIASLNRWPITSLHPFGNLVEELGSVDDENVEIKAILRDNNFDSHKFSEAASSEAEKLLQAITSAVQDADPDSGTIVAIQHTQDLVEQAVALEQSKEFPDQLQLTIYTLDLTPYYKEETALDRELRHKATGVYILQLSSPLLPQEHLKNLSFSKDRKSPAIAVTFTLNSSTYEVLDTSIRTTTIKPSDIVSLDKLASKHESLYKTLFDVAAGFRKQRGASLTATDTLLEARVPLDATLFVKEPAVTLFAELNHRLNATIAQKLLAEYGSAALLLKHPEPYLSKLEVLAETLKTTMEFNTSSAGSIAASIAAVEDKEIQDCLGLAVYKVLNSQRYVAAGRTDPLSLNHYWYNLPAYTHFNAPLRRYADHIVHRQLHALLDGVSANVDAEAAIAALAPELSFKLECSKNVQVQSIHLALSQRILELSGDVGQILCTGIVVDVHESSFDVIVPELSIEKRIHGDQLPLVKAEFDKESLRLELYWDPSKDAATYTPAGNSKPSKSASTKDIAKATSKKSLSQYLEPLRTSKSGNSHVQEIRLHQRVPVLVCADLGVKVLPSITVRTVNPFYET